MTLHRVREKSKGGREIGARVIDDPSRIKRRKPPYERSPLSTHCGRNRPKADTRVRLWRDLDDPADADEVQALLDAPIPTRIDLTFQAWPPPERNWKLNGMTGAQVDAFRKFLAVVRPANRAPLETTWFG